MSGYKLNKFNILAAGRLERVNKNFRFVTDTIYKS